MSTYYLLDHTADVGIVATGETLGEALTEAARGLFSVMVEPATVEEREVQEVEVESPDLEALVVDWLNELIFFFEARGFVVKRCQVLECTEGRIRARCYGEQGDPTRHHFLTSVKAATYHGLRVEQVDGGWRVQVILDI